MRSCSQRNAQHPGAGKTALNLILIVIAGLASLGVRTCQQTTPRTDIVAIDTSGFFDSAHHWYDIDEEGRLISPRSDTPKYNASDIVHIADNILLYQKENGGWPKNYDMQAILTEKQKDTLVRSKAATNTTFDNGTTHSQVEYLANAYRRTGDPRYRDACIRGLDFILSAQYRNGGWPQFYPETTGYRRYVTFNDGAMTGVLRVLHRIAASDSQYVFIDKTRRLRAQQALQKGIDCILKCQIVQDGVMTGWGQQHDNIDLRPRPARAFEPAAVAGEETAEILLFLMRIDDPDSAVVRSVRSAVEWLRRSTIHGTRVKEIEAPRAHLMYQTVDFDRIVVEDSTAPPLWARFYELGTNRPLFCNRDAKPVYSLAEVDRERRTGYSWYTYLPDDVLRTYPSWEKRCVRTAPSIKGE